jgi:hypothetical protein
MESGVSAFDRPPRRDNEIVPKGKVEIGSIMVITLALPVSLARARQPT